MKLPQRTPWIISSLFVLCMSGLVLGQDEVKSASDADASEDANQNVTTLSGVFEAIKVHQVSAGTEQLKSLKIQKIVPHGSEVEKDQNLVWFQLDDIDKQINEAQSKLRISELTFQDDQFAHEQFLEAQKLDRSAADRAWAKAKQDYDNFVRVDRERQIESAEYSLNNAKASLENAMEELNQLEQMYKEDDLTEESEEIVLKRAKQSVDNARYRLKGTEITTQRTRTQTVPRMEAEQEEALTRARLQHDKSIRDLNTARQKREIEMRQKADKFKQEEDDFQQLQDDRKKMVVRAPAAGIAFHGKLNRGRVSDKPSTLVEDASASGNQVLLTIAQPSPLQIRVDLAEKDLAHVKVGDRGTVKSTAYPDQKLTATVKSVSTVPYAGTKYDCVLSVKIPKGDTRIVPGMTCKIELQAE